MKAKLGVIFAFFFIGQFFLCAQSASTVLADVDHRQSMNLNGDWPMRRLFHAIFCRNVVIYFDEGTQAQLWSRIARSLFPGGCLYIGHSERVSGCALDVFENVDITTYRLRASASL